MAALDRYDEWEAKLDADRFGSGDSAVLLGPGAGAGERVTADPLEAVYARGTLARIEAASSLVGGAGSARSGHRPGSASSGGAAAGGSDPARGHGGELSVSAWRRGALGAAVLVGLVNGMRDALEDASEDGSRVEAHERSSSRREAVSVHLAWGDPSASVAIVRPWLL